MLIYYQQPETQEAIVWLLHRRLTAEVGAPLSCHTGGGWWRGRRRPGSY